jgi:hypothetical protein
MARAACSAGRGLLWAFVQHCWSVGDRGKRPPPQRAWRATKATPKRCSGSHAGVFCRRGLLHEFVQTCWFVAGCERRPPPSRHAGSRGDKTPATCQVAHDLVCRGVGRRVDLLASLLTKSLSQKDAHISPVRVHATSADQDPSDVCSQSLRWSFARNINCLLICVSS